MQYLLSEEEMAAIQAEREALRCIPCHSDLVVALTNVCKMVATTMIPTGSSAYQSSLADGTMPRHATPYGCIHVNRGDSYGYCDRCPVQGICPMPKEYSK